VRAFWVQTGWPIITADSDASRPFNLAQARNNAVRMAETECVIVADADALPTIENILIALLTVDEHIVWPYTLHRYISAECQGDPFRAPAVQLAGMPPQPAEGYSNWTGSIYVALRSSYWHVGGFDERFTSWGGEDACFRMAANTLVGVDRVPGLCVSFNHDCPGRNAASQEGGGNPQLLRQYRAADLHPMAMLRLVKDTSRFLSR